MENYEIEVVCINCGKSGVLFKIPKGKIANVYLRKFKCENCDVGELRRS